MGGEGISLGTAALSYGFFKALIEIAFSSGNLFKDGGKLKDSQRDSHYQMCCAM